jgi:hypothetical protein
MKRCPKGTKIQTVIFPVEKWTAKTARKWLKDHGFTGIGIDRAKNYLRFRQESPSGFLPDSFRTIALSDDVSAVIGCPVKNPLPVIKIRKRRAAKLNPYPKIPEIMVLLGEVNEIAVEHQGEISCFSWPKNTMLLTCPRGKLLLVVSRIPGKKKVFEINEKLEKAAKKLWGEWSDFEIDKSFSVQISLPKGKINQIGFANHVVYTSDKWTGKEHQYIHEFDQTPKPRVWSDDEKKPLLCIVEGGKLKVKEEGITG